MLTQKIREDMKEAMKAHDELRRDTLRGALSAFTNELVAKGKKPTDEISDDEVITVLKRLGKQRKEAVEQYEKGGRSDLAEKESAELKIIETYLPQMASREQIEKVVREKVAELGVTDAAGAGLAAQAGKLTGAVLKSFAGGADGNLVKEVVAQVLAA